MRLALKLAEKGIGSVEPNPAVGCVITRTGQEIGRGYHKQFGGPHAEINALENCKARGFTPEGATMYVTLEPCCHQGKTGPCTQAVIAAQVRRVVAATLTSYDVGLPREQSPFVATKGSAGDVSFAIVTLVGDPIEAEQTVAFNSAARYHRGHDDDIDRPGPRGLPRRARRRAARVLQGPRPDPEHLRAQRARP